METHRLNFVCVRKTLSARRRFSCVVWISSMAATQAGAVRIEIDNMNLKMPSNARRKVRCNHSSPRIQTTVSATTPFQIKHLMLEVADL